MGYLYSEHWQERGVRERARRARESEAQTAWRAVASDDIWWITRDTPVLEYVIRTRRDGWRIVLDDTVPVGIVVIDSAVQTQTMHPDCLWHTLEMNTRSGPILPPNR